MTDLRASLVLPLFAALAACGGATPPPAPVESAPSSAPSAEPVATATATAAAATPPAPAAAPSGVASDATIPLVAFKIVSTEKSGEVLFDVHDDGTFTDPKSGTVGKIDGTHVFFTGNDPMWTVAKDGVVAWSMIPEGKLHFDDKDNLILESPKGNATIGFDDAGKFSLTSKKGKETRPFRVEGMSPRARRAATLIAFSIPQKK